MNNTLLQQIHTTLRTDIKDQKYVSSSRWRSFQAPCTTLVLQVFMNSALGNMEFWKVLAKRDQTYYATINIEIPSLQRDLKLHKNVPNIAFELGLLRLVCKGFRESIPFTEVAKLYTSKLFFTIQHAYRRFGLSERQLRKLKDQRGVQFCHSLFSNRMLNVKDILEHCFQSLPAMSMIQKLASYRIIAQSRQEEFELRKKVSIEKSDREFRIRNMVLNWLRSEKMDTLGKHVTFAVKHVDLDPEDDEKSSDCVTKACKAFTRQMYYVCLYKHDEYMAYYLHYLNLGFNYVDSCNHSMVQCCTDLMSMDFYVEWDCIPKPVNL